MPGQVSQSYNGPMDNTPPLPDWAFGEPSEKPKNYFIFLGSPEHNPYLVKHELVVWTAHRNFTHNDVAFFYITAPFSMIVAQGIMLDDIFINEEYGSKWEGRIMAEILVKDDSLEIPISKLRALFPEWSWLKMPRQNTQIPADIVKPFLELRK